MAAADSVQQRRQYRRQNQQSSSGMVFLQLELMPASSILFREASFPSQHAHVIQLKALGFLYMAH